MGKKEVIQTSLLLSMMFKKGDYPHPQFERWEMYKTWRRSWASILNFGFSSVSCHSIEKHYLLADKYVWRVTDIVRLQASVLQVVYAHPGFII